MTKTAQVPVNWLTEISETIDELILMAKTAIKTRAAMEERLKKKASSLEELAKQQKQLQPTKPPIIIRKAAAAETDPRAAFLAAMSQITGEGQQTHPHQSHPSEA